MTEIESKKSGEQKEMSDVFGYLHTKTKKRTDVTPTWGSYLAINAFKVAVVVTTLQFTYCILDKPTSRPNHADVLSKSCV